MEESGERPRSGSFGSSLRRIFSPSKTSATTTRRGGSLNRPAPLLSDVGGRESSLPVTRDTLSASSGTALQAESSYQQRPRQSTPVPPSRDVGPPAMQTTIGRWDR